jgi:hypothetical protein
MFVSCNEHLRSGVQTQLVLLLGLPHRHSQETLFDFAVVVGSKNVRDPGSREDQNLPTGLQPLGNVNKGEVGASSQGFLE